MSMTSADVTALRAVAKDCLGELLQLTHGVPESQWDAITKQVLDKYTALLPALPPTRYPPRQWLAYYTRLLRKEKKR